MSERTWVNVPRYLTATAGLYALLGGALSLAGWAFGVYRLTDWTGSGITIKANAALAAAAAGATLLLSVTGCRGRNTAVCALGGFVATVGGLTLLQHLTEWNLGIDTLLFDEPPGAEATASPGRMGPPASLSFLLLGIASILITRGKRARGIGVGFGVAAFAIGLLAVTGYLYGAQTMYTVPRLTGIAGQTATFIVALGAGLIAAAPDRQPMRTLCEESIAGSIARRMLPTVILLPLVLGWLRVGGERLGFYDSAFGSALRSVVELTLMSGLVWWSVQVIRERDLQRRRAERSLQSSRERLSQTLASITDGFIAFDRDWRFVYVNLEGERLLGRSREQLLGKVVWTVFPEMVDTRFYHELQRAKSERRPVAVETQHAAGARHFTNRIYPTTDGGLSVYFQDITARKAAEDSLRDADRRKDEFLATLAHELRNPLTPIRNAAHVLATKAPGDSMLQWGTEVIGRQVQHMARLLEDLLDVSRISLNRLELRKEWVEVAALAQGAVETSRPAIDAAGHELTLKLPSQPVYVDGDPVRLAQVLANLLNNAAKYTERGGHIVLAAECHDGEVIVRVRDDGIGIASDLVPRVFEMFVQAQTGPQHAQGGLGIGLWLARAVIERHGGRIEALSAGPGQGSEFVVRLPRVVDSTARPAVLTDALVPAQSARRLLIVDDLKDSADSLAVLLQSLGHEVKTAYGGEDAIDVAAKFLPEVILLDIGMPVMDGFEVCRRIRRLPWGGSSCIIALTGWGQPGDRRRTEAAGFDHHLIKPVDLTALGAILAALPLERAWPDRTGRPAAASDVQLRNGAA